MILIIAEKPSVMKNIIDAKLENNTVRRYKGYSKGNNFIYTHCIGHLLTLKMPNEIDEKYRYWNINDLPFNFKDIPLKVSLSVKDQFDVVSGLLKTSNITEIVNACDSDREGDLIFRNIIKYTRPYCKNISRMWIESQTREGITESFNKRLKESEYNNVYFAGKARSYADYIIGLNSTRAMSSKFGGKDNVLTIGRVQTPTLRILVDNEKEILDFKSKIFYKITANGVVNNSDIVGNFVDPDIDQNRFYEKDEALKVVDEIGIGEAIVTEATTTRKKEKPRMLYSLSDLQVDMDKRYHMSPIDVLNTVQSLYERHKLVTYPRTDENHISSELAKKSLSIVKSLVVNSKSVSEIVSNNYKINKIMISKKDLGAHEALTPTGLKVNRDYIKKLTRTELNVYMAIVERFLASFYPDAVISKQKIVFVKNNKSFESKFEICTTLGHRAAYTYNTKQSESNKEFLKVNKNDVVDIKKLNITEGHTNPPSRFTEGTLIKTMKNPVKYVSEKENKDILKKVEGIGTEATRAHIIEELKKRGLIEDFQKKYIKPTNKGINLIDIIPSDDIKSVELTAYFEKRLGEISNGKFNYVDFLDEINKLELDFINSVKGVDRASLSEKSVCKCPVCGSVILENEKAYSCSNRNCDVVIFKNAFNAKHITKTQAMNLFTKGNSVTKVLCVSKAGKDFEALMRYKYDKNAKYHNSLSFDFNAVAESEKETNDLKEKPKVLCKCPNCGSSIIETNNSFKCSNEECKVEINKHAKGIVKLTKKAAKEMLTEGITSTRLHVVCNNSNEFNVYLKYQYDNTSKSPNKIDYVFEKEKKK